MTPNMISEVIDAIHLMWEDEPYVECDCMLYLKSLVSNDERAIACVDKWFEDHNRCEFCGDTLRTRYFQEPHTELDGCPYEMLGETYCPTCNMGQYKIGGF